MGRRGRPPHPDILTPREWEVLALVEDGYTNDEIATRLGISLAGAKFHVSEILGKLHVSSRDEAAHWYRARYAPVPLLAPLLHSLRPASLMTAKAVGVGVIAAAFVGVAVLGVAVSSQAGSGGLGDEASLTPAPTSSVTPSPAPSPTEPALGALEPGRQSARASGLR